MCIAAGGPVYRLISKEQAIIRAVATTLSLTQITSAATKALVRDMRITMHDEYGIGIAAPQVGAGAAIFVAFIPNNIAPDVKPMPETVFYNPTLSIVETGGYVEMWESCLTIPDKIGKVKRRGEVIVNYFNEKGEPRSIEAKGFTAAVLQHEHDHLNGVLYTDHIESENDLLDAKYFFDTRGDEFITPPGNYIFNNFHIPVAEHEIVGINRMELRKE